MRTCHAMGGHRSLPMGMVWVWVQFKGKCWALHAMHKKMFNDFVIG